MFGLVTTSGQVVSLTDAGSQVSDERNAPRALANAFLNVPLYLALYERFRNRTLPSDNKGLEAAIRDLGVVPKQVATARQVFQRSATTAGFFAHGTDRLVMPAVASVDIGSTAALDDDGGDDDLAGHGSDHPIMRDPLIVGLLERLPDPATGDFPEKERELWLATLEMNLAFIYSRPTKWKFERPEPGKANDGGEAAPASPYSSQA